MRMGRVNAANHKIPLIRPDPDDVCVVTNT